LRFVRLGGELWYKGRQKWLPGKRWDIFFLTSDTL